MFGNSAAVNRRGILRAGMAWAAQVFVRSALGSALGPEPQTAPLVAMPAADAFTPVPANFTGLGYELSSVAQAGLLSDRNSKYVQLVMNLGAKGVLRLGGIVADSTRYLPQGPARAGPNDTVIDRASLLRLRGFLEVTGWTAIWSVNFGSGTLPEAIDEAKAVHKALGPTLDAIELGNEVENYSHGPTPLRPPPYTFTTYLAEYREWHRQLLAAVPKLRFAAPDTAGSTEWVEQMAAAARGDVQLLTTHYYRGDQHTATLDQLLQPDPALLKKIERLRMTSRQSGIPWRLCETNSFFGGGRPGVSDTFAAALWTLHLMLELACSGCSGLNLETGTNQLGFLSSYSPIRATENDPGNPEAGPSYYGMLAFAATGTAGAAIAPLQLNAEHTGLYGYEVKSHGRRLSVVCLNLSPQDRMVRIPAETMPRAGMPAPLILRLAAASLHSQQDVSVGGAQVDAQGMWETATSERAYVDRLSISAGTAVVLRA